MSESETPKIFIPGQRICRISDSVVQGIGTFENDGILYSTLAGYLRRTVQMDGKERVEIMTQAKEQNVVPSVDSLVTARISNANPRFCKCEILSVENTSLTEPFSGMIRKEDVRATEKDRVEMYKSYRPGDIVIARVVSLGDSQSYVLTTAENELGVVCAHSQSGVLMVPISWCEMQCPKTLSKEFRKVAKVQPRYIERTNAT